ncbi:MAG: hypothetical protein HDT42_13295 [Ruminococcaceae bacterium]|nr:hypothetical protein [Oscillospiraceae bacterium]
MPSDYQKHKQKVEEMNKILQECSEDSRGLARYGEKGALEIILKYVFNKKNYEELSDVLLKRFGSIREIFSTDMDELYTVKELGRASAEHICFIGDVFRIESIEQPKEDSFLTFNSSLQFCRELFNVYVKEAMYVVYIDNHFHPIVMEEISKKLSTITTFDIKKILRKTMEVNAEKILITHNHPNGTSTPSSQDISTTRRIAFLLKEIGIVMVDHIIIAGNKYCSFRKSGYFDGVLD